MGIGSIGFTEILVIAVIVLIFFGPQRLPEVTRALGGAMREFRRSMNEIQRELEEVDRVRKWPSSTTSPAEARSGSPSGTTVPVDAVTPAPPEEMTGEAAAEGAAARPVSSGPDADAEPEQKGPGES